VVIVETISNYLIIRDNKKIGHGGDGGSDRQWRRMGANEGKGLE
jgi:hypothetical protein